MTFRKISKATAAPSSPEKLILDLPRRKIPGVLAHQAEVMRSYAANAADAPDVALQLPTGSGKTLVGTLIGEWIRRKRGERVLYLVPTKQLVHQVVDQCENKYGLQAIGFAGSSKAYTPLMKSEYRMAEKIAVATYSSLFNSNPFFNDAQTIIIDDAHVSENYVSQMWSVLIESSNPKHHSLFATLSHVIRQHVDPSVAYKLQSPRDMNAGWIDKLPSPTLAAAADDIRAVIEVHANDDKRILYPWTMIRDRLEACHLYFNESEILIRPLVPPTWTHTSFGAARQRIYMSATLGAGGDLERLFGRTKIKRIPVPEQWDTQGVGRRLFLFPGMGLDENESSVLRLELMRSSGRSLVLVPNRPMADTISDLVRTKLGYSVVSAEDIEEDKAPFTSKGQAVAVIANRYDGIDFPGEDCRLMFVDGLPKATNAQERFLMSRMGANVLFNERVQTRVLQAIGRCTRSLEDYSTVVIMGDDLQDYLTDKVRRAFLHPEIQAELQFGIDQSKGAKRAEFLGYLQTFLANGDDWEAANENIISYRSDLVQETFPAIAELEAVVPFEIEYQKSLWQGDYVQAMDAASRVLGAIVGPQLRGYRALWNYLAGSAALLAFRQGALGDTTRAESYFFAAKNAALGLPWLVALATRRQSGESTQQDPDLDLVMTQVEQLELVLSGLGSSHDRRFAQREKEILDGIAGAEGFEDAHVRLGELLGFSARKIETDASPDPWWSVGGLCLVFEDHAGAQTDSNLSVEKIRQAADHPRWIRSNISELSLAEIVPVLVSPARRSSPGAKPHLADLSFWPLDDFRAWAGRAVGQIRELRKTFSEPGDLVWRAEAARQLRQAGLDFPSLLRQLRSQFATDYVACDPVQASDPS